MFGSATIDVSDFLTDVQINGTSVVSDGVAEIPVASDSVLGAIKTENGGYYGLNVNSAGRLAIAPASFVQMKGGTGVFRPVVSSEEHTATFYGLAKAAGDVTQSASSNAVGTYTDEAKAAIQTMLDVPSTDDIPEAPVTDVQVNGTSILSQGVANVPKATSSTLGVVRAGMGLFQSSTGEIVTNKASNSQIKSGENAYNPIVPNNQHLSVFYGLAKAAGDTTQSASSNAVGIYTDDAKTAIQTMLGIPSTDDIPEVPVTDVQVAGTSILNDGTANVPVAGISTYGVVKATSSLGIGVFESGTNEGRLFIDKANTTRIKVAADEYRPIVPQLQHVSVFYGLTKAAGVDMASSNNAVGTYTDEAKVAIKSMLGVNDVVTDVTVSGTTPTITAVANTRYICGEVATLDFTPSSTGICDVIFESGSTATVLTLPNTVKMPEWFDATTLEPDTIYEISIVDGVYGAVMSWQA